MQLTNLPRHHSAEVLLSLVTPHGTYPLAQIGPDDLIFAKPVNLPPCDAEIVMQIDGSERRWPVRLAECVTAANRLCKTIPR